MLMDLVRQGSHFLSGNSFLSGGFVLMVLGGLLSPLRTFPAKLFRWAKNRILVTVQIDNTDPAYAWARAWISSQAKSRYMYGGTMPDGDLRRREDGAKPKFILFPAGAATFKFKGRRLLVWMSRTEVQQSRDYRENICIRCFSLFKRREFFQQILEAAHRHVDGNDGKSIEIFIPDGSAWQSMGRRPTRRAGSLILDGYTLEYFMDDIRKFLDSREWYESMGIPWRRTYLLYGPPGSGKSSLATVAASELERSLCCASLSQYTYEENLVKGMARPPFNSVILLEDIDRTGKENKDGIPSITTSSVLNMLDGAVAAEGRIIIMTTNHIDKLDPALIRSGRVDVKIEIGNATADQAERMYRRFFPDHEHLAEQAGLAWEGRSMSDIQEHFLRNIDNPEAAICIERKEESELAVAA